MLPRHTSARGGVHGRQLLCQTGRAARAEVLRVAVLVPIVIGWSGREGRGRGLHQLRFQTLDLQVPFGDQSQRPLPRRLHLRAEFMEFLLWREIRELISSTSKVDNKVQNIQSYATCYIPIPIASYHSPFHYYILSVFSSVLLY